MYLENLRVECKKISIEEGFYWGNNQDWKNYIHSIPYQKLANRDWQLIYKSRRKRIDACMLKKQLIK